MPTSTTFAGRSSSPIVAFFGSETLRFGLLLSQCSHPAVVMGTPLALCFRLNVFPSTGMMSSQNLTSPSPSCFTSGFAENSTGWSSWLTHALRKVTVRCPSKKYWVVYEPGGILPGSVPPYMHSGTQPRILACWCSPPPRASPQALNAKTTRATNTPEANSALSLIPRITSSFSSPARPLLLRTKHHKGGGLPKSWGRTPIPVGKSCGG